MGSVLYQPHLVRLLQSPHLISLHSSRQVLHRVHRLDTQQETRRSLAAIGVVALTLDVMVVLVDTRVTAQRPTSTGVRAALVMRVATTAHLGTGAVVTLRLQVAAAEEAEVAEVAAHQHYRLAMEAPLALWAVAELQQKVNVGTLDMDVYAFTGLDDNDY